MENRRSGQPELTEIVGALLLAQGRLLTIGQIQEALERVNTEGEGVRLQVSADDIRRAVAEVQARLAQAAVGIEVVEVAQGWRIQTRPECGRWVRALLSRGDRTRLSRPALETLAIIAYRQPCTRAEIEAVRGVSVDHILRNLLEMELIRIAGRSRLPGRPLFFATTTKFLEHFGLKSLDELPAVEELRRRELAEVGSTSGAGRPQPVPEEGMADHEREEVEAEEK